MHRNFVLAGVAVIAANVAIVLALHGTGEEGLRAAIRATARVSALCTALAFARIRARDFGALLPVSHALHYALIIAAGLVRTLPETAVGVLVYAVMVWNAIRPTTFAIYVLWISFLLGMVRPGAIYVVFIALLLGAGVVRWVRVPNVGRASARPPAGGAG